MKPTVNIYFVEDDLTVDDFSENVWQRAEKAVITKCWSGAPAPPTRFAEARLLATGEALWGRFDCAQHEPFVVSENPDLTREAARLWERDVCEIFIAPDINEPERYFEFEVAPTGEWLDYAVHQLPDRRETDTGYHSGIRTAAKICQNLLSIRFPPIKV